MKKRMKIVTRKQFYNVVGPMDVVISVRGKYPYEAVFVTRSGFEVGCEVDGQYFLVV